MKRNVYTIPNINYKISTLGGCSTKFIYLSSKEANNR